MTPTRPATLLALVAVFALAGYLLAEVAYGDLPRLSGLAALTVAVLAVVELGMARVVRDRVAGRSRPGARPRHPRPLHPLQVARAAVLSRASSTGGAVLLGLYGGLLAWTLPRRDELASSGREALVAGLSALACLALVGAALLLERACRTPDDPRLGSAP